MKRPQKGAPSGRYAWRRPKLAACYKDLPWEMRVFSSLGEATDGRPVVEVCAVEPSLGSVRLRGTASVYEGNLLIHLQKHDGSPGEWHSSQASAGGPGRGTWEIELPVQAWPVRLQIGEEDAKSGGLAALSVLRLLVHSNGEASQVTSA
jgi:hypothetical protein